MTFRRNQSTFIIGVTLLILLFLQSVPVFADETEKHCQPEKIVAHGGGAYLGYETTNSVEALKHSIQSGYKMIELDMDLSKDRRIIMIHDWDRTAVHYFGRNFNKKITLNKFLKLSIHGQFEVLTFDKLADILDKHPEVRIITDTKGDNLELLSEIAESYPGLVDRIVPQIYDYEQWSKVKELGFQDIILTLYAMANPNSEELLSFARDKNLYALTMPDYMAEKGLCSELSQKGIRVYVHPISDYEEALQFMEEGAWGIYSGTLLLAEFEGFEKNYYLISGDAGSEKKLDDKRLDDFKELKLHGLKKGETFRLSMDDSGEDAAVPDASMIDKGKHKLFVAVMSQGEKLGSLEYLLWKDNAGIRILQKKYEYRLDSVKPENDFNRVMTASGVSAEIRKILERSLVAKKGEYIFYNNGNPGHYMNGDEFLPVQEGKNGKLLLPLNTTAKRLGAASVTMDRSKDISVVLGPNRSLIMADTSLARRGFQITRLKSPVVLYMNKAMAEGEFYQYIAKRPCLEENDYIILLPKDCMPDAESKNQIFNAVEHLFENEILNDQ